MNVIYLARNNDNSGRYEWLYLDPERTDNEYWRGWTFDNIPVARSKRDYREVQGGDA